MQRLGGAYTSAFLGFFLPAYLCGGHFALVAPKQMNSSDDFVLCGRLFQRLWLMASKIGLYIQMESGPVIFSRYVRDKNPFTENQKVWQRAVNLEKKFANIFGNETAPRVIMLSRIGKGKPPKSRAIRLSLDELIYQPKEFEKYV